MQILNMNSQHLNAFPLKGAGIGCTNLSIGRTNMTKTFEHAKGIHSFYIQIQLSNSPPTK